MDLFGSHPVQLNEEHKQASEDLDERDITEATLSTFGEAG
jgi:hypothetical protein